MKTAMRGFSTPQETIIVLGVLLLLSGVALQSETKYLSWPMTGAIVGALGVICVSWGFSVGNDALRRAAIWLVGLVAYTVWLAGTCAQMVLTSTDWKQQWVGVGAIIASLLACIVFAVQLLRRARKKTSS